MTHLFHSTLALAAVLARGAAAAQVTFYGIQANVGSAVVGEPRQ